MVREVRRMRIYLRTEVGIEKIAEMLNPKLRGWINYYGKFRKSGLKYFFFNLNVRLLKWIRNKYKRFRQFVGGAKMWLKNVFKNNPKQFAYWSFGVWP
jgi:hypothetical protein